MRIGKFFKGLTNIASQHLPEVLFVGEVVAIIGVGYFSGRGALEADKRLAEYNDRIGSNEIATIEKARIVAPCFVPAVIAGLGAVGMLLYGRKLNAVKVTAALTAAATAEKTLADNREAIEKIFDKKGLQKIDSYVNQKHMQEYLDRSKDVIYETGHGNTLCCETYLTGKMFHASPEWIRKCVNDFNSWINAGEDPCFNDFLSILLPMIDERELPDYGESLRMRMDRNSGRLYLMDIQMDSGLSDTGEPYLMFTQRTPLETRRAGL